jgi:hypothetical protein
MALHKTLRPEGLQRVLWCYIAHRGLHIVEATRTVPSAFHWCSEPEFLTFKEPRNRFQGINSASLCSLTGRYDNPNPTLFLTPIDCLKIPEPECVKFYGAQESIPRIQFRQPM